MSLSLPAAEIEPAITPTSVSIASIVTWPEVAGSEGLRFPSTLENVTLPEAEVVPTPELPQVTWR